ISPIFKALSLLPEYTFNAVNLIINNINDEFFLIRNLRFSVSTVFYYSAFIITLDKFNITKKERIILFSVLFSLFIASFVIINIV
ncbi:MAG: hypothetical protein J6R88_00320, partial [Clostridia bacterium]|nr:hypothetical protein [Clostridia bacterium]